MFKSPSKIMKAVTMILTLFLVFQCESPLPTQSSTSQDDLERWKLGWSMFDDSYDGKNESAVEKFELLIQQDLELVDNNFIHHGMMMYKISNSKEKIDALLARLPDERRRVLCCKMDVSLSDKCPDCNFFKKEDDLDTTLTRQLEIAYFNDQFIRGNVLDNMMVKYAIDTVKLKQQDANLIQQANIDLLKQTISTNGYPSAKTVSGDAMRAVFLILQHSDSDPQWQREQLQHVKRMAFDGDLSKQDYAYFHDRVLVNNGEPQLYGTQYIKVDKANNIAELGPVQGLDSLEYRRMEVGLMPSEMYRKIILK